MHAPGSDGAIHGVEWLDMRRLARAGIHEGALEPGERIRVTGSANRDPEVATMTLVTAIRHASDGWQWSRPAPVGGDDGCAVP